MPRSPSPLANPTLETAQAAGFVVGGEPLALDLADTIVLAADTPADLLADEGACRRFWELQKARLPQGWAVPSLAATRRLRDAIRQLLDSALAGLPPEGPALQVVNEASAKASIVIEGKISGKAVRRQERWVSRAAEELALGAAARSAIDVLAEPTEGKRLRRCASPKCSMLFVNGDARRRWCTPNICGNRARVARHYRRQRTSA